MPEPHLWEIDHPYYCTEGNRFARDQHTLYASWTEFAEETAFVTGDRDENFLIRWDWKTSRTPGEPLVRDIDGDDRLLLFFVLQRKAWLLSVEIPVTDADESAVRAFLTECAQTVRDTWEPLLTERDRCIHVKGIHDEHHIRPQPQPQPRPVDGCPWCKADKAPSPPQAVQPPGAKVAITVTERPPEPETTAAIIRRLRQQPPGGRA